MRITVESAEVATLKADGRAWDGPGRRRVPPEELAAFFALDLTRQLERLVAAGEPPDPPEVFVRIHAGGRVLLETSDVSSFDPRWTRDNDGTAELAPGTPLRIQVWDRDLLRDDLIGDATLPLPPLAKGERYTVPPFGQVRKLVLRFE